MSSVKKTTSAFPKSVASPGTARGSVPIHLISPTGLKDIARTVSKQAASVADLMAFKATEGQTVLVQNGEGRLEAVLFGLGKDPHPMSIGKLARTLPKGNYAIEGDLPDADLAALSWQLGSYRFDTYKKVTRADSRLVPPKGVDRAHLAAATTAHCLARDLINTPASDMGPDELEKATRALARQFKARVSVIKGDDLLKKNFPMIHAVGRASTRAPRLIDLTWGPRSAPKVTLVGKGVVFDTGGLNIKPGNSMALMKKDMGGAANVLGLAHLIMATGLNVRLRVLIPAVENAISGNAFRPGDVLASRKGITVEIGNTDAEGRLILADALALGDEEKPDLMIDMATLTGAARVALGPDLPPFYCDDDGLAAEISAASEKQRDPLWRMPLWAPYQANLSSRVADVNHITSDGFAGSVTAALFLKRFVNDRTRWVHLDVFGWVPKEKPWATVGGDAQGIRALHAVIAKRFG